jgi:CRP-like cAMP-binding protein
METPAGTLSLDQLPAFAGISRRQRAAVRALATSIALPAGAVLMEQGNAARECFIVASGQADVLIDGEPVATIGPGEVVGELALLTGGPRTATVRARTDVRVFVVAPNELASLLDHPPARRLLLGQLASRLRDAQGGVTR